MKVKTKLHVVLSLLLCCLMIVGVLPMAVLADDAEDTTPVEETTTPPAHNKVLTPNADGTYTLSLSVTGSKTTSSEESGKADVIVVLDTSGSMAEDESSYEVSKTGRYGYNWRNGHFSLYKKENGQYYKLTSDDYAGTVYQKYSYPWEDYYEPYNGTRYIYNATGTRIDVAKSAVNALAEQLLSQNTDEINPQIRLSLITFNNLASLRTRWTSDISAFKKSVSEIICRKNNGGTNWEDALDEANKLQTREDADVYVIFVSDGEPTFRNTPDGQSHWNDNGEFNFHQGNPHNYYGSGNSDLNGKNFQWALDKAIKIVKADKNLYCIGAFGQEDQMLELAKKSEAGEKNYYSASNQQALLAAFADIATRITNELGYKNITITDPLTEMTSTSLEVAADGTVSGFTYTRSGGTYGTGKTWEDAPKANFDGTTVTWNLKNEDGSDIYLENGVTYTVSFKVWPSPEAYETVAAIMNGEDVAKPDGIVQLTDGSYGLNTNGKATIKYTQVETTTSGGSTTETTTDGETDFTNPAPIPLNVGKLTVTKVWEDSFSDSHNEVTLEIQQDGASFKTVTLNEDNEWKADVYVAPGIKTVDDDQHETIIANGHTYTVVEKNADDCYEFSATTCNPMIVNGELDNTSLTLTATNTHKGSLSIKKIVDTINAPEKDFQVKVTFTDKNNSAWTPSDATFPSDGIFKLKDKDNITISNLPTGIEYNIEEVNIPDGFTMTNASPLKGKIVANTTVEVQITNTYTASPVDGISIPVTKVLTGPEGEVIPENIDGAFTFTLEAQQEDNQDIPMPEKTSVEIAANGGTASFQGIKYSAVGTYHYTITESGQIPYITNDIISSKVVTVVVEDNGNGKLVATVYGADYTDGDEIDNNTTFTNTYHKPEGGLTITKKFVGAEQITEAQKNSVTFTIKDATGNSVADFNYKDIKDGKNTFKLAPGKYTVTESNVDIDSNYYTCTTESNTDIPNLSTLAVESDNDHRRVEIVIEDNGTHYVNFINTYTLKTADLTITKTFDDNTPDTLDKNGVIFTVTDSNTKKVVASVAYKDFTNGSYTIPSLPLGEYIVTESNADVNGYKRTTKYDSIETDSGKVKLPENGATVAITNTYEKLPDDTITVKIPFTKIVEQGGSIAPSSETFQLEIVDFDKNSGMSYTAKVTTDGKGSFKGYIVIEGPKDTVEGFVDNGFYVQEVNTSNANWRYSENKWFVKRVNESYEFWLGSKSYDEMTFVNTYTNNSNEDHFVIIPEYWSLRLTKVDANDPTYRLAGAQFDLYRVGKTYDTCVGHYTTNSAGEARAAVTRRGEYYWVETQSPAGYTLETTRHYTHTDTQDRYITVENVKTEAPTVLNSEDHYAYVIGYEDGLVHPEAQITRAETATIFFRLLNEDVRSAYMTKVNSFSDVHEDDWFNTAVSTMASLGMIKGYPDGTFGPNDPITRAEFAAIAARFDPSEISGVAAFTDIAGHWSEPEVSKAAANGWVNGYTDNSFKPDQNITRAEAMALVNRVLNRNPGSPENLLPDMITWPDNMDLSAWYYLDVQEATNSHTYERQPNNTELWIKINEAPDWTILEK